jgi:hypothetical protein
MFIIEPVDLSSFKSVKDFVKRLSRRITSLHVVQLAGGIATFSCSKTDDGHQVSL